MHNAGCVTVSTRTGVNDFSSDVCIKGKLPVMLNYSYIKLSGSDVTICFRLSLCDGPAHLSFVVSRVFYFKLPKVYAFK